MALQKALTKKSTIVKKTPAGRATLLAAAEELFVKRGYQDTSVDDILSQAKISKGGFYHHFASKGQILEAIIENHLTALRDQTAKIVGNKELSAKEKLARYLGEIISLDCSHNHLLAYSFSSVDSSLVGEQYFNRSRELILPLLLQIVRQGVREGVFKTDQPAETLELLLLMKQASIKFLPEMIGNRKKFFNYMAAMNEISERALGLEKGFFDGVLKKYLSYKQLKKF